MFLSGSLLGTSPGALSGVRPFPASSSTGLVLPCALLGLILVFPGDCLVVVVALVL